MSSKSKRSSRFNLRFTAGPLAGQTFSLGMGEILYIGRDPACAIRIEGDPSVSARHACIHFSPQGKILFKDLGSETGTRVNGKKIKTTVRLRSGDRITVGLQSTFQGSTWSAMEPSRFTRIAMQRFSAIARKSAGSVSSGVESSTARKILGFGMAGALSAAAFWWVMTPDVKTTRMTARLAPSVESSKENPTKHFVWDEIVNISRRFGDAPPSVMDPAFVEQVEMWIDRFTRSDAHLVLLKRREKYWPVIESALRSQNLPIELGYVVWVESAFVPDAESSAGARGLWQFMPETAREYGLRVDGARDERLDPVKSSQAAASYFTMLLRMFGSDRYLLALASYNTGQNRVERRKLAAAVRRARRADFWHIHSELPQETADYVPKILAAMIVGRNPDRW
jgi:hypothetical protein